MNDLAISEADIQVSDSEQFRHGDARERPTANT
jgi:hypothetical protein